MPKHGTVINESTAQGGLKFQEFDDRGTWGDSTSFTGKDGESYTNGDVVELDDDNKVLQKLARGYGKVSENGDYMETIEEQCNVGDTFLPDPASIENGPSSLGGSHVYFGHVNGKAGYLNEDA